MPHEFPKEVAVAWSTEDANEEDHFLTVDKTPGDLADGREFREVGVYQLVRIVKVREIVETKLEEVPA